MFSSEARQGFGSSATMGFPCGGVGVGCILVHSTFWKSPSPVPGAHQKKLRFTAAYPITHRSHMNALEI
jgi:hypothetical protein